MYKLLKLSKKFIIFVFKYESTIYFNANCNKKFVFSLVLKFENMENSTTDFYFTAKKIGHVAVKSGSECTTELEFYIWEAFITSFLIFFMGHLTL